jgi:hypothetical protein
MYKLRAGHPERTLQSGVAIPGTLRADRISQVVEHLDQPLDIVGGHPGVASKTGRLSKRPLKYDPQKSEGLRHNIRRFLDGEQREVPDGVGGYDSSPIVMMMLSGAGSICSAHDPKIRRVSEHWNWLRKSRT